MVELAATTTIGIPEISYDVHYWGLGGHGGGVLGADRRHRLRYRSENPCG